MDGWNMIVSFWGRAYFSGAFAVSLRECKSRKRPSRPFPKRSFIFLFGGMKQAANLVILRYFDYEMGPIFGGDVNLAH